MKLKDAHWKESYDKPDSVLKSRDITLPTMVHVVKVMVPLVLMYESETWTIKKAEHQKINTLELW